MRRRDLLSASCACWLLLSARAFGQTSGAPKLIGWLSPFTPETQYYDMLISGLKELGHVAGRGISIERRWANGDPALLRPLARELLALRPAVILTVGTVAVAALKAETATVPVVFAGHGDPVGSGVAASLARPGGNVTGVMLRAETNLKVLEQVREAVPGAKRVALLTHDGDPAAKAPGGGLCPEREGASLRAEHRAHRRAEDIERAVAQALRDKAQALLLPPQSMFYAHQKKIAELALTAQLPLFSTIWQAAASGALLAYAQDLKENFRRAAVLVDKILRGANRASWRSSSPTATSLPSTCAPRRRSAFGSRRRCCCGQVRSSSETSISRPLGGAAGLSATAPRPAGRKGRERAWNQDPSIPAAARDAGD